MDASEQRVFHFHASSNALGGVLTHPHKTVISSAANSALSNAGGHHSSPVVPVHVEHVLHCEKAYTHVTGGEEDEHWATLTSAVVEKVNLLEVVTADRIVAQIASTHPKEGNIPTISFVGSQFVNLRINGQLVEPVLDLYPFPGKTVSRSKGKASASTNPKVCSYHRTDVRKLATDQSRKATDHKNAPNWVKRRYGWLQTEKEIDDRGHLLCSLVKEIKGGDPDNTFGHIIHVPGFGNIFLAEVSIDAQSHYLTMLRAEMGCASTGPVSMSSVTINGKGQP